MNFEFTKTLEGGYSIDKNDNVEKKNTYQKAINGRLYSENNTISFTSIDGTKIVYLNNQIVKYIGYYSFKEELIVFAKCLKTIDTSITEETITSSSITSSSFKKESDVTSGLKISLTDEITINSQIKTYNYKVYSQPNNPTDFETPYSCQSGIETEIDLSKYYSINSNVQNLESCNINNNSIPINNIDYLDCIYSFKIDNSGSLIAKLLWVGMQNWNIKGKISTEGIEENEFFKRVYYTDSINTRKVVNVKDPFLLYRTPNEFNQVLENILLQPEIIDVIDGGSLKSMKALYVYRIISENGQLSDFSPTSFFVDINPETDAIKYRGGNVSEITSKLVRLKCNILNPQPNAEIQCFAIEYETLGIPTSIKNLGTKPISNIVEFKHFGNEPEFTENIVLEDIVSSKNTWKYCNDFTSKKNKLIAVGLRNNPTPSSINNLEYLFPLHSWDKNGNTHDCLMNPEPWKYRYIDPSNTDKILYVKQKVYKSILSFGPLSIKLKNNNGDFIEKTFLNLSIESYTNITSIIYNWLVDEKTNNPLFLTYFPNLDFDNPNNTLLFKPIDTNIQTDMLEYFFESNNQQFIENFDNDIRFLQTNVNTSNLIYGAKSIGFDNGIGLRITYREYKEPLLKKANNVYDGTGKLLDYFTPSGTKFCMKGEIYRIAFQAYDNSSERYFSIPIGDIFIPEIGDLKLELDNNGNAVITNEKITNQSVIGDILYGHGIKLHIEVRLDCSVKKDISMFQLLYVKRDEENRTILCQGISAPLMRVQYNNSNAHKMPDPVRNKWILPYCGGPTYELRGMVNYDNDGENDQYTGDDLERRVMTHRSLMYFDSPDLYFNKISDHYVNSSKINVIGKINTDHTPGIIRQHGGVIGNLFGFDINLGDEIYPKFSRKILENQIEGNNHSDNLPRAADEDNASGTFETHFINVSVFSDFSFYNKEFNIIKSKTLLRGEEVSGIGFNLDNDISNNSFVLASQPWFYGGYQRDWKFQSGRANSTIFKSSMTLPGYKTTILKTDSDLFTYQFYGNIIHYVNSEIRLGGSGNALYDVLPLINLYRNNRDSVYGGRTQEDFSNNLYIPLTKTIPVLKTSNAIQYFDEGIDTYVSLNIRTKVDYGKDIIEELTMNNGGGARAKGDIKAWKRNSAWNYVCVLETMVEPKQTYGYEFYKETSTHKFDIEKTESINKCYFNELDLKSYIPKPFKFKDDPNQGNVIAVSEVKLAGEKYDSWTVFPINNFYAQLEKNKGDISNVIKYEEQIFAIQEQQTSLIYIGTDRIITDSNGDQINIKQGSGSVVDGHKILSRYGTKIRNSVILSDFGFYFFDERNIEFIKNTKPLLLENLLHLHYWNKFKNKKIIDVRGYYDHEHKETNILLELKENTISEVQNEYCMLSYNELFKVFNGEIEYKNNIFIMFNKKVYSPLIKNNLSEELHILNEGDPLSFFGSNKKMTLGLNVSNQINKVFQYKTWGAVCNIDYSFNKIFFKSNLGYDRTILGTHNWYKIREGIHTVPAINETNDINDISDVRGSNVYVEMEVESKLKNRISILAIINSLRISHL